MVMLQKTLRDGHLKALQGKLELLERLCRALQKERNDLNNRLSLRRRQGDKDSFAPPEAHQHEPLAGEEEEEEEEEKGEEEDEGEDECLLQGNELESEGIHQTPSLPKLNTTSGVNPTTTVVSKSSQPAETSSKLED